MIYISLISLKSNNGDMVHVKAIRDRFEGEVVNTRNFFKIRQCVLSNNDIIIRDHPLMLFYSFLLPISNKNIVLEINGCLFDEFLLKFKPLAYLLLFLHKIQLSKFKKIYFVSKGILLRTIDLGYQINNFKIIPNGSNKLFNNYSNDKIVVGFVGKNTVWQSLDQAVIDLDSRLEFLKKKCILLIAPYSKLNDKYKNIEVIVFDKGTNDVVNFIYSNSNYILVPDNRFYKSHLMSSPIKFHMAISNYKYPIIIKHNYNVMLDELNQKHCTCLDCTQFEENDFEKICSSRNWDLVYSDLKSYLFE